MFLWAPTCHLNWGGGGPHYTVLFDTKLLNFMSLHSEVLSYIPRIHLLLTINHSQFTLLHHLIPSTHSVQVILFFPSTVAGTPDFVSGF